MDPITMLFDSLEYWLFFFTTIGIVAFLSALSQRVFLVFASYVFYCSWDWRFGFLLAGSTAFNFLTGKLLDSSQGNLTDGWAKKRILVIAVAGNLIVLGFFKYYNFFAGSVGSALGFPRLPRFAPR